MKITDETLQDHLSKLANEWEAVKGGYAPEKNNSIWWLNQTGYFGERFGVALIDDLLEARGLPPRVNPEKCDHEWVDMRNEFIESGEMCKKCYALRPADGGETDLREQLSYRERRILELRDDEGKTREEIAAMFKVTPERIRQIENQSRKKLAQLTPDQARGENG